MSNNRYPSLQTLPVEILHCIFDRLDIQTIVLSVRNTCRQLRAIVQSYNRYNLNLNSISYSKLKLIHRFISPESIRTLTISQSFGRHESLFRTKELTQVRILTITAMRESALRDIIKLINISALVSLSIDVKESNRYDSSIATYLTSILIRSKLRKLVLNMESDRIKDIRLFGPYTIEYLELSGCLSFEQINQILRCMPQLRTLVIGSCSMGDIRQTDLVPFESVAVLALKQLKMNVKDLEYLLRLMPSLTHLKLIGHGDFFDGHRWERFIQTHLPLLNVFEFVFNRTRTDQPNCADIERIIQSFQTPFWLQLKKWFVTCEYIMYSPESFQIYSTPNSTLSNQRISESTKISMSTTRTKFNEDRFLQIMNDEMMFIFPKLIISDMEEHFLTHSQPIFSNMKKLILTLDSNRSMDWISILSTLTDLTTITHITVLGSALRHNNSNIVSDMSNLLRQACNASTVNICSWPSNNELFLTPNEICQVIPNHVRYLTVSNIKLDEFTIVLERLEHLSVARCIFQKTPDWSYFHKWSRTKKHQITSHINNSTLRIWFKKADDNIESNELNSNCKRIKLTDEHHD